MEVKLWGIGGKTPNRGSLSAGDRVLIYTGAPEYAFIGHAELASTTHEWSLDESARYPGSFEGGVVFLTAEAWQHPVPMKTVLPQLELKETNPNAHFFSGRCANHTERLRDCRCRGGRQGACSSADRAGRAHDRGRGRFAVTAGASVAPAGDGRPIDFGLLFKTAEKLTKAEGLAGTLSEYDTRAEFIDKYLEALGYTELGDIQRGSPVESGNYPDYVLVVNGQAAISIEAKKLGAQLGSKEAGQVVAYCSNLGVRWGAVTDGRYFKLYDAPMLGVSPEERLVLSVDLADYKDREDFEARIYPELELIAKTELESGAGLERRVATAEAVRELLTASGSKTLKALRKELDETKRIRLSASELSELVSELLG